MQIKAIGTSVPLALISNCAVIGVLQPPVRNILFLLAVVLPLIRNYNNVLFGVIVTDLEGKVPYE